MSICLHALTKVFISQMRTSLTCNLGLKSFMCFLISTKKLISNPTYNLQVKATVDYFQLKIQYCFVFLSSKNRCSTSAYFLIIHRLLRGRLDLILAGRSLGSPDIHHYRLFARYCVTNTHVCDPAGTRDLPEVHQRTTQSDDMAVGRGLRETVAASQVQFHVGIHVRIHVRFHVSVHVIDRSGFGHEM